MVTPAKAIRRRTPGGSSIWPKTNAALSRTPDSSISRNRSVPSLVLSPTPAKTETPPCCVATRLIISVMRTVFPTPAPPNRPILPPSLYGVRRSITLIPVSNIFAEGSRLSKLGAGRWISHFSSISSVEASTSSGSPITFHTCPRVTSPTGTSIPDPVFRTAVPRVSPSVGFKDTARTLLSPIC